MSSLVIWVIDDDPIDLKLTARALSKLNRTCEVTCARTIEELECAAPPDVILLDWNMPLYPNGSLIPTLRAAHPRASVLILSGATQIIQAREAIDLGAVKFLEKQFTMSAQVEQLERAIAQLAP